MVSPLKYVLCFLLRLQLHYTRQFIHSTIFAGPYFYVLQYQLVFAKIFVHTRSLNIIITKLSSYMVTNHWLTLTQ